MQIRKLTLAAAVSLSLTLAAVSAENACCPLPQLTDEQLTQKQSPCGCPQSEAAQPCTGGCPISSADQKQVFEGPQIWQVTGAAADLTCPVTGSCMSANPNAKYKERQIYSYPSFRGMSSAVPASTGVISLNDGSGIAVTSPDAIGNDIMVTGAAADINSCTMGCPVSAIPACPTGAAAPVVTTPCPQGNMSGAKVTNRSDLNLPGNPVQIQSETGMKVRKRGLCPSMSMSTTGAAAAIAPQFGDVPDGYWAKSDIDRLTAKGIMAGYPDRTFKPNNPVSRAEFANILVTGLNLQGSCPISPQMFTDVPKSYWANDSIEKAYSQGYVVGYSDHTFRPVDPVTKAEALTAMSKAIPGEVTMGETNDILGQYSDGRSIPCWAKKPVAESLRAGLSDHLPDKNMVSPEKNASRAEVASMMSQLRTKLALDDAKMTGAAAGCDLATIPALSVKFEDHITANASHVGDKFKATTTQPIVINGVVYPEGSKVMGRVVEVQRPDNNSEGALKVAFSEISDKDNKDSKAALPSQILTAQVQKSQNPNIVSRTSQWLFVWPGRVAGTAGRTVGSVAIIGSNALEQSLNSIGVGTGEIFQNKWGAAGRSYFDAGKAIVKAPFDATMTTASGIGGMFNVSVDEMAYLVNPDGTKVSKINPNDEVAIAFGCVGE